LTISLEKPSPGKIKHRGAFVIHIVGESGERTRVRGTELCFVKLAIGVHVLLDELAVVRRQKLIAIVAECRLIECSGISDKARTISVRVTVVS
jgi:hypothetical protein